MDAHQPNRKRLRRTAPVAIGRRPVRSLSSSSTLCWATVAASSAGSSPRLIPLRDQPSHGQLAPHRRPTALRPRQQADTGSNCCRGGSTIANACPPLWFGMAAAANCKASNSSRNAGTGLHCKLTPVYGSSPRFSLFSLNCDPPWTTLPGQSAPSLTTLALAKAPQWTQYK